ncbi:MAG: NAD-binding protein [Burkholderiales bacterium]|nr:MAG: NAD-binding protein [Burkholderiales bacterium]
MSGVFFVILRRLRLPLIALITAYAIAVGGLVLMPGVDPEGRPWHLSFFHAFYVMSYTATTIGFGEIPYRFSDAQRMWMTFSIYLTVVGWAYTLGSIFALAQDVTFRQALARSIFARRVRRITDPFFVLCGYGQSGQRLAGALDRLGYSTVLLDPRTDRLSQVWAEEYVQPPIFLAADARSPETLEEAGVRMPNCTGVIAITPDDEVNQTISIGAKVLSPQVRVLARVKSQLAVDSLEAFGGVISLNPFETFAFNFSLALAKPDALRLEEWLTGEPGTEVPARVEAPRGHWVIAGYGRFGSAITRALDEAALTWKVIDIDPVKCGDIGIVASGLAEDALRDAGIDHAAGLVAGTDNDASNLAIVTAARRVKPGMFVVIRQNNANNRSLIEAARARMRFVQADLMSHECLQVLTTPMLNRFLMHARTQPNSWAQGVAARLRDTFGEIVPYTWAITCDPARVGMRHAFEERPEPALRLSHLLTDPDDRQPLPAQPLMLLRRGTPRILPDAQTPLEPRDRVLFAGPGHIEPLQRRLLEDDSAVDLVRAGRELPRTPLGRWLAQRSQRRAPAA